MKHYSKANWSKGELRKMWGDIKHSKGNGPRAQTRALAQMEVIKRATPAERQKMRQVMTIGGKFR